VTTFAELVASRKAWIANVLQPWCRAASRNELLLAEQEWTDIAGKVDPEFSLWRWAWSRFPELVHESLGIEETSEVEVRLRDGTVIRGYPDSRQSRRGQLVLLSRDDEGGFRDAGPFTLDNVESVRRLPTIDPAGTEVP
jgi:hypothetical protein